MKTTLISLVVLGKGFTPQVFGEKRLGSLFPDEPRNKIITGALALLSYPGGYEILVQEERIEVKLSSPASGSDQKLQKAISHLLGLWPLVEPRGLGLNFQLARVSGPERELERAAAERLLKLPELNALAGRQVQPAEFAFGFTEEGARVNCRLLFNGTVERQPAMVFDFNVHYDEPANLVARVKDQQKWFERVRELAARIGNGD
ncbi:MAG: hypothetical protein ACM3S1_06925 [Hyphomicrobiales bacterium]